MKSFIFLTFAFLALAWYQMSGGADFNADRSAAAAVARSPEVARADTSAAPLVSVAAPPAGVVLASARAVPAGQAVAEPAVDRAKAAPAAQKLDVTLASAARIPLARPSDAMIAKLAARETKSDANPDSMRDLHRVTGSVVNMRSGPGTAYHVVDQLRRNAVVEVVSENVDGWVKLRSVDGARVGWMSNRFLDAVN
ncbi:SH3 domain-containing protein [Citreicella sp. C3M06]|uniref:SH3 domain-containing protein n=1 Tax=Citreicella sp. C3M06 TaxID=2841564 RepID=UPI001C08DD66|nr:SH3 domain-containing protein [Citreicella sp. C3M06]MBU2959755.1 SH3 domain-containing protein [Citreicella sp. C3M06]